MKERAFSNRKFIFLVSFIILFVLLLVIFVSYFASKDTITLEYRFISFIVVFLCFGIGAFLLSLMFAYRLLSPLNRILEETKQILSGDYHRRLHLRPQDSSLFRYFIAEVNIIIERLEQLNHQNEQLIKQIDEDLKQIVSMIERNDVSEYDIKNALISFKEKTNSIAKGKKK